MSFSSILFLTLFLPCALVAAWGATWMSQGRSKGFFGLLPNLALLGESLVFAFWTGVPGLACLIGSILFNDAAGRALAWSVGRPRLRKPILGAAIFGNLLFLGVFKYAAFVVRSLNMLPGVSVPVPDVLLPLGISFYTFQAISYLVDVFRGTTAPARTTAEFALYMAFFPQLLLGPIVRFGDFRDRLEAPRTIRMDAVASGFRRFLGGLAKKVLLADTLGETANAVWAVVHGGHGVLAEQAWLGLVCYALQLYFDFGGYSDMAIGLGRMLGFELPENFHHPYCAGSVRDFWRRWHVTLSSWLRDYLYIPLGGNRKGLVRTCLNGFVVFAVCGLWHGAGAMFLLWGLWHGFFLTAERLLFRKKKSLRWTLPGHVYTIAVFLLGWVFFRSESLGEAGLFLRSLSGLAEASRESRAIWLELSPKTFLALAAGVPLCYPVVPWIRSRLARVRAPGFAMAQRLGEWLLLTLWGLLSYLFVAGGSYKAFLYAQF